MIQVASGSPATLRYQLPCRLMLKPMRLHEVVPVGMLPLDFCSRIKLASSFFKEGHRLNTGRGSVLPFDNDPHDICTIPSRRLGQRGCFACNSLPHNLRHYVSLLRRQGCQGRPGRLPRLRSLSGLVKLLVAKFEDDGDSLSSEGSDAVKRPP